MTNQSDVYARLFCAGSLLVLSLGGCVIDTTGHGDSAVDSPAQECSFVNFDKDADNVAIAAGDVVQGSYLGVGVTINVWQDESKSVEGLGVAFDSDNPTGGDSDLAFTGAGNILINQETFDAADIAAGFVAEPDDEARGALFEFHFEEAVCIQSMALFDIDFGEDPAQIKLYDDTDTLIAMHHVDPMGNNIRLDVSLPATECTVRRMTVLISSSGAMDDVEVCRTLPEPEMWTRIFDGGGDDLGNDVAADSGRSVVVAGTSDNGANTDGTVRKYDSAGLLLGATVIDNGDDDQATGVAIGSGDDIVVVGAASNGTDRDVIVRRYDSALTEQWTRVFDGGDEDGLESVAIDSSGDILVVGFTTSGGDSDIFVRKYSATGTPVWTRTIDVGAADAGYGVATDASDNVYVAGRTDNGSDFDMLLRKYNSGGTEQWTRAFDGGGDDTAYGVAVDTAGDPVIAGAAWGGANSDVFIRKYDASGATVWTQTYDGGGHDAGRGIATDAGDNVIVNGSTEGADLDGWTRKLDSTGVETWTEIFDRGADDQGTGVATDMAGGVLATGNFDNGSDLDLFVVKYRP